jgi:uncharacterized membrane protein
MPTSIEYYVPQCAAPQATPHAVILVWSGILICALVIVGLIVAAPLLLAHGDDSIAQAIYLAFHPLCHQIAARSFYLAGHPLAVCARCTGLYAGFAAGAALYPLMRSLQRRDTPARIWLLVGITPVTIDFAVGLLGIWANTHLSRFLTGALCGAVCAFFVVPGLMNWHLRRQKRAAP